MNSDTPKTIVVHVGGIGDLLLTFPALSCISKAGPLEILGRRGRVELAVTAGIACAAWDLEDVDFHTALSHPTPRLLSFLARFRRAIVWMKDDGAIAAAFARAGVPRIQVFPGLPPYDWRRHASEYYGSCLGFHELPQVAIDTPRDGPSLDVLIHPGSGSPRKNWPISHYGELADRLERLGRRVDWRLGPAEDAIMLERGRSSPKLGSLVELAGELPRAKVYVGNDSGVSHLAAMLGARTVAIFGPTDPRVWAPRGPRVQVVQGKPWPTVETVLSAMLSEGGAM